MASKEIEIETTALDRDTRRLSEELELAKNLIRSMTDDMAQLNSMWDGPANEAFMAQYARDEQYAQKLCGMVQRMVECMEYARKQYDTCEGEVRTLISSI